MEDHDDKRPRRLENRGRRQEGGEGDMRRKRRETT